MGRMTRNVRVFIDEDDDHEIHVIRGYETSSDDDLVAFTFCGEMSIPDEVADYINISEDELCDDCLAQID